jgi:hypothetical protein
MITSDIGEQEFQIRIGSKVVTSDGHALGKVSALLPDRFTVEKGLLSKRQTTIPRSAINTYDPDGSGTVYLKATQDDANADNWTVRP